MKNTNKSLLLALLFFMSHWALYGQSETVIFLDIPGLDGEYTLPSLRPVVTSPGPKQKNIRIERYDQVKTNTVNIGSITGGGGAGKAQGTEMDLTFRVDQSIIELSNRLFNKTITPYMNLFIDSPGSNSDPQRERMRIKLTNVRIKSIDHYQDGEGIPMYHMKITFESNLKAVITYNFDFTGNEIEKYCWSYKLNSICSTDF